MVFSMYTPAEVNSEEWCVSFSYLWVYDEIDVSESVLSLQEEE